MSGSGLRRAGRAHEQEARVLMPASQGGAGLRTTRSSWLLEVVGYKASM
jgi:hypothetical protein